MSPFSDGYNVATRNCLDWAIKQFRKADPVTANELDNEAGSPSKPRPLCDNW
jgi:hypothetical protein